MTEVIVVVSVLALLAAILIPVSMSMIRKADQTDSSSNLRELAKGLMLFTQDHKGRLPSRRIENSVDNNGLPGFREYVGLDEMVFDATVYTCPASDRIKPSGWYMHRTYAVSRLISSNWEKKGAPEGSGPSVVNGAVEYLTRIQDPARTLLIGGGVPLGLGGNEPGSAENGLHNYSVDLNWTNYSAALYPFDGAMMVVFADGHVEAMRPEDFAKPRENVLWGGTETD